MIGKNPLEYPLGRFGKVNKWNFPIGSFRENSNTWIFPTNPMIGLHTPFCEELPAATVKASGEATGEFRNPVTLRSDGTS